MKYLSIILAMFIMGCGRVDQSAIEPNWVGEEEWACVSFSRIGFAGEYTDMYLKIWRIKNGRNAEEKYVKMAESSKGTNALYGLMGLKIIKSNSYQYYAKIMKRYDRSLSYGGGGCLISTLPVKGIVEKIDSNNLRDPSQ